MLAKFLIILHRTSLFLLKAMLFTLRRLVPDGTEANKGGTMYKHDYTDMVAGGVLIIAGGATTAVSVTQYPLGTLSRMGPGMFPAGLGGILAFLGVVLTIQALRRPGYKPDIRVFSPLLVLGAIAAFALIIVPFGLIPAILAITIISSLAELRIRAQSLALLCLALCLLAPGVFKFGLGLNIPLFAWPF